MLRIANFPNFARTQVGGIVNTNLDEYNSFVQKSAEKQQLNDRINNLEKSINKIMEILQSGMVSR